MREPSGSRVSSWPSLLRQKRTQKRQKAHSTTETAAASGKVVLRNELCYKCCRRKSYFFWSIFSIAKKPEREKSHLLVQDFTQYLHWHDAVGLALIKDQYKEYQAVNRKLIRPSLSDVQEQMSGRVQRKKPAPPEQTNAENFYYLKQMQSRTPMVVVLDQGETIHGVIEWYDKQCIKVHRPNEPNLLIMKSCIRYMFKEADANNSNNGNGSYAGNLEVE